MNKAERIKMVKAMEYIARNLNNEHIFYRWLMTGVADGDIAYGDLASCTAYLHQMALKFNQE